jgi:hypothetical protein
MIEMVLMLMYLCARFYFPARVAMPGGFARPAVRKGLICRPWPTRRPLPGRQLTCGCIRVECVLSGELMNRTLITIGIVIVLVGLFWKPLSGLPLFRLPGDIVLDRPGFKVFFPITTMIVISLVVSLLLWLFRR